MIDKLIDVQVVLCRPGLLGVSLLFANGFTTSYPVGNLKEVNEELLRLSVNLRKEAA